MDGSTIQLIATILCCIMSVLAIIRSGSRKSEDDAREMGKIEAKLDNLEKKLDSLIADSKEAEKKNSKIQEFISRIEEQLKTLFVWRDSVEKRLNNIEQRK